MSAVLLVPTEGDLIADGPCGARPPTMWDCPWCRSDSGGIACGLHWQRSGVGECECCGHEEMPPAALVLAVDGKPVAEGCLWAAKGSRFLSVTSVRNIVQVMLHGARHGDRAILEERGTIVLLDSDGREVHMISVYDYDYDVAEESRGEG